MSSPVRRAVVEVFYETLSKRNMCTNATFLNDGRHQLSHRTLHQFRDDGGHRLWVGLASTRPSKCSAAAWTRMTATGLTETWSPY